MVLDVDPRAGHEQLRRPALVLSAGVFNRAFGIAFVAPVTSKPKGHAFEIPLPAGCGAEGSVMVHQLRSLVASAPCRRVGTASLKIVETAAEIVKDIIG